MRLPRRNRVLSLRHVLGTDSSQWLHLRRLLTPHFDWGALNIYLINFSSPQTIDSDKLTGTLSRPNRYYTMGFLWKEVGVALHRR